MPEKTQTMRVRAEDSDIDNEDGTQTTNNARAESMRILQELDLGTDRAGKLKQDDRKQKHEDRANVKHLLQSRDACQVGTEANALYLKNKSAIAAWNNPKNVVDNHEEKYDTLDDGNAHRQRMRNQYGGRVEEPNDWEAGYSTGGRGQRGGGFTSRGARGGMTAPSASRASAASAPRAGIAPRPGSLTSRAAPTQTADYRPLDPALDVSDPRSKYGRTSSRGGTPVGRGGGNAGRGSGRADFNARATQAPAPARVSQPRDADRRVDLVNDSAAFMRAVGAMRMKPATTKAETNPTTTIEASTKTEIKPTTGVQPSTKTSSTTIFSKWADIGSAGHPDTEEPVTKTSLRSEVADTNADIRQVPTSEFALPPPHRGETESWTDGFPSAHPSDFNSPVVSSHPSNQSNGPSAVAKGNLVGLGIQRFATSMNDDESSSNHNTANDVNLLDLTEDLKELQEPAKNRVALVKSIVVNGYRYILDESALGNASVEVIDATPRPPPESARIEVDLTSSPAKQVTDNKPEQVAATTGNRNAGAQTTPSLAKSIWGDPAPPRGANLFPSGNTPARANRAQVSSPGTFLGVMGPSTEEGLFGFIEAQLTSAGGPESITSTPNFSFSDGRCADRMNTTKSSVDEYGCVGGEFIYPGLASRSLVIDRYELVRLQKVGDSSYGMTPSAQTARPSSQSTPDGSAAPPPRNKSSATSVKSDATTAGAHKRGMSASKYANTSTSAARSGVAVGTLSFDNLSRYHSGNAGQGPPRIEAGYGTQSTNVSRHSAQDENTNPHHANVTSNSTVRPGFRAGSQAPAAPANSSVRTHMGDGQEYKPISSIRRPAGAGYELLQAENAAANARSGNAARAAQQAGLFSPTSSNFPTVEDDGYESEL